MQDSSSLRVGGFETESKSQDQSPSRPHAAHHRPHRLLPSPWEERVFYGLAVPSCVIEIASGIVGSIFETQFSGFITLLTVFLVLNALAWLLTVLGMVQRSSWVRDEGCLPERRRFLYLAVRLNRLMLVS